MSEEQQQIVDLVKNIYAKRKKQGKKYSWQQPTSTPIQQAYRHKNLRRNDNKQSQV